MTCKELIFTSSNMLFLRKKKEDDLVGERFDEHDWQKIANVDVSKHFIHLKIHPEDT